MNVVIRMTAREEAKALPILLRHSPGVVLPDRTYVLSVEAIRALQQASVTFTDVGTDAHAPSLNGGAETGERV